MRPVKSFLPASLTHRNANMSDILVRLRHLLACPVLRPLGILKLLRRRPAARVYVAHRVVNQPIPQHALYHERVVKPLRQLRGQVCRTTWTARGTECLAVFQCGTD